MHFVERLELESHTARLYYSNKLRMTTRQLVSKVDGVLPWELEYWKTNTPQLSNFLSDHNADYGSTEEDYIQLITQFYQFCQKEKWLHVAIKNSFHSSLKEHLPYQPRDFKWYLKYFSIFFLGLIIGWLCI